MHARKYKCRSKHENFVSCKLLQKENKKKYKRAEFGQKVEKYNP